MKRRPFFALAAVEKVLAEPDIAQRYATFGALRRRDPQGEDQPRVTRLAGTAATP